jgi:diguanylate cyclase (GGDEF)-like protein
VKLISRFLNNSPWLIFIISLVGTVFVAYVDFVTGSEMAFSLFYLAPIALTVWFVGMNIGLVFALLSAVAWFYADVNGGRDYSQDWIPYWNSAIRLLVFVLMVVLLNKIKRLLSEEQVLADTDPLTTLYNRRAFLEKIDFESKRSNRYGGSFTLVYIDLDNFKSVNDKLGHDIGDELLVNVANILKTHVRSTDISARLGGDEFALLMPQAQTDGVVDGLEKLKGELQKNMSKNHWPVTFSIGAATFNRPDITAGEMLNVSDQLMYRVKKSSKNAIVHESFPATIN